jgi:Dockerin type I domain
MEVRCNTHELGALVACIAFGIAVAGADGQTTALYDATGVALDPASWWGWTPHNIGPGANHQGLPIANDAGTGLNAWGIDDNLTSTANPFYSQCLDAPLPTGACSAGPIRNAAIQYGWRYSTKARFAVDHGTTASMGLSLWIDNRGYFVLFDLDGSNLRAMLLNAPNADATITLTSGGVGATAYHDIALVYRPASQSVAFEFDGVVRGITSGEPQLHDNAMLWGNLSAGGRGGQKNFHRVEFEILLPGDYNRNGLVDAADYTVWRNSLGTNRAAADGDGNGTVAAADYAFWKNRYGNRSVLVFGAGSGISTPEPSGIMLPLVGLSGLFALVRRRASSPPFAK